MMEKYEIWRRVLSDMKDAVDKAEHELFINQAFLKLAEKEIKKYPKPKGDDPKKAVRELTS